ncbi:MAG: hypothetical protein CM1200mP18_18490 [Gammaproteobacteria bacterium]|nr:MAG: hypothetical protein CM1200mP18_18490 [Gammaproteobacteria bacterium]
MDHYSAICKSHPTSLPETFNFGRDVVDHGREYGQDCSDLVQRPQTERVLTFQDIADSQTRLRIGLLNRMSAGVIASSSCFLEFLNGKFV